MQIANLTQPVYLAPFTAKTVLFYHLLRKHNVVVSGFLDNNAELQGQSYDGCEIRSPRQIQPIIDQATVVICSEKFFNAISHQLIELGVGAVHALSDFSVDDSITELVTLIDTALFSIITPKHIPAMRELIVVCQELDKWKDMLKYYMYEHVQPYAFTEEQVIPHSSKDGNYFLLIVNGTSDINNAYFNLCLESIAQQAYRPFDVLFICSEETRNSSEQLLKDKIPHITSHIMATGHKSDVFELLEYIKPYVKGYDYILTLNAEDTLSINAVHAVSEVLHKHKAPAVITAYEDRIYKNSYIAPYYKDDYVEDNVITLKALLRNFMAIDVRVIEQINTLPKSDVFIIQEVLYHYRIDERAKCENDIKPIAFYLPQFHPIPENDKWWGKGFTEWVNVKRAYPMFNGHYQPHEPGMLGYYDLVADSDIQRRQIDLAKQYGIHGFCYYYYWFNGERLLEKPLDRILKDRSLDFPFCICWANETWSRRWDGSESEVLMQQVHNAESDRKFILDVIPILKDPRYIKVNDAPLLLIYRADMFEDLKRTIEGWKKVCAEQGIPNIHVSMVQTFGTHNPLLYGCDSATEFPPHNRISSSDLESVEGLDPDFSGQIIDYKDFAARAMNARRSNFLRFRGAMLSWDNTARRLNKATIYKNAEPEEYKKLLLSIVDFTSRLPKDERLIFINAWNEWAEGTHLEPDNRYGDAYLKATLDSINMNC